MSKTLSLLAILLVVSGAVFAEGLWTDGTYSAEADSFNHGWKDMVRLVVENGYIVEAHFDAIPEDGDKLKYLQSVQGEYGMVANSDAQERWYVQIDRAAAYLLEQQDPGMIVGSSSGVDAVSGASITMMPHFELSQQALSGAQR